MPATKSRKPPRPKAAKVPAESFDALRRRESARSGVVRLGRRMISTALQKIERPKSADRTNDIHDIRVMCKRLRALFRLLRPVTNTEAVARENARLRQTGHSFGDFRDAFVASETFKRVFKDAAPRQMSDAARLLGVKGRPPKTQKSLESIMKDAAASLRRTSAQLGKLPITGRGWTVIAPGLRKTYSRARDAYQRCQDHGAGYLGDDFHTWRKRVKDLTYQLELLDNLKPGDARQLRKSIQRLGSYLGDDHDYLVFAHHVRDREKHYLELANFRPVRKRLRRRLKKLRAREFSLGDKLFADKPKIWITRLSDWWRVWKNPSSATPTIIIEPPLPSKPAPKPPPASSGP